MDRLRSKKAEVSEQLQRRRFEPEAPLAGPSVLDELTAETATASKPPERKSLQPKTLAPKPDEPEPDSYTSRLLKAKKRVWEDREEKK